MRIKRNRDHAEEYETLKQIFGFCLSYIACLFHSQAQVTHGLCKCGEAVSFILSFLFVFIFVFPPQQSGEGQKCRQCLVLEPRQQALTAHLKTTKTIDGCQLHSAGSNTQSKERDLSCSMSVATFDKLYPSDPPLPHIHAVLMTSPRGTRKSGAFFFFLRWICKTREVNRLMTWT